MRSSPKPLVTLPLLGACLVAVACGETRYETQHFPVQVTRSASMTCTSPFVTPDLSKLKPCDGGHCYAKTKLPFPPGSLPPCDGDEVCVPDKVLRAGGKKLEACTFFLDGRPAACMSLIVKDVADVKDQLQQGSCDADERCSPCINPLTGNDTFACADGYGVHEGECTGGQASDSAASCCHGMGVCMTEESAPAETRDNMKRQTCAAGQLCAPASMTTGTPVKCDVLGFSGVCLDLCFAAMFAGTSTVMRAGCQPTEMCMPCAIGKDQGLRGCD